ncbi:MAG: hypothetical protein K6T73_01110 [Candidatus Bathyarchaeota archaeon]|nr:hypothetical protein [Candidatus Bathyarchaeota archaeon]
MEHRVEITKPCLNYDCRHNIFWTGLRLPSKSKETKSSREILNCCCLINHEFTLEEIGDMWGLTRDRIRQLELKAVLHSLRIILYKKGVSHPVLDYSNISKAKIIKRLKDLLRRKEEKSLTKKEESVWK